MANNRNELIIDARYLQPEAMPRILRLVSYEHSPSGNGMTCCTATLFHRHIGIRVAWTCRQPDSRLHVGALVSIRWNGDVTYAQDAFRVAQLLPVEAADEQTNLFDTLPPEWVADQALVGRGRALINQLPRRFKLLFNAIFWNGYRFLRYTTGPSSLGRHHVGINGNLEHCIEVAEVALRMSDGQKHVFRALIILGSLLHDAGKAEQYHLDMKTCRLKFSERGVLVGQRMTVLEWLAVAKAQYQIEMPQPQYLALVHILTAVKGAPDWMGLREPQGLEASLIEMADRWSTEDDLQAIEDSASERFLLEIEKDGSKWWV